MSDDSEKRWTTVWAQITIENDGYCEEVAHESKGYEEWWRAGRPLLTPRARAVLEAVEAAVKECNECDSNYADCKIQLHARAMEQHCPLAPIRKAMEENGP